MIGTIANIQDDAYEGKDFKKVTLGDGKVLNVKYGKGGSLKAKWGELVEGQTYEWVMGEYNGKPFVRDFIFVGKGLAPTPKLAEAPDKMTPDMWADKDKVTRLSIERQTSVKCACEIASDDATIEQILETAEKIAGWIANGVVIPTETPKPAQKATTGAKAQVTTKDVDVELAESEIVADKADIKVNMDWLIDVIKTTKWDIVAWVKDNCKVETKGGINQIVARLDNDQKKLLIKHGQELENLK